MANNKTGFAYYNVDTDRYLDIKIKRLKKDFGCNGIAVYDYLLAEIYRVRGCYLEWNESIAFDVADYFDLKEDTVYDIVLYCGIVGLFDQNLLLNQHVLSARSIQKRFLEMSTRAKRKEVIIPEEYKILPEEYNKIPETNRKLPEVSNKIEKNKVNILLSNGEEKVISANLFETMQILIDDYGYLETLSVNKNIADTDKIKNYLKTFFAELETRCEYTKTEKEVKMHFSSWLNIVLTNEQKLNNNGRKNKKNAESRTSSSISTQSFKDYSKRF